MTPISRMYRNVGIIQFFLASSFVIWLLLFPDSGPLFAWPVTPRLTAMFIGTSFILRAFIGFKMWREPYWHKLRWIPLGSYGFLAIIFLATFWHAFEMNWKANIIVAHIWVLAYIIEPVILPFVEPRGEANKAPVPPGQTRGPILPGLRGVLLSGVVLSVTIGGLLFINPDFLNTRWPWQLDQFNARIMAAWPVGCALWAAGMYFATDWAEIRMGMQTLILYTTALFVVWLINLLQGQFDPARLNIYTYGVIVAVAAVSLSVCYWRQERAPAVAQAHAPAG